MIINADSVKCYNDPIHFLFFQDIIENESEFLKKFICKHQHKSLYNYLGYNSIVYQRSCLTKKGFLKTYI